MKPTKSILDSSRPYVNSTHTDLRVTFARIRREQEAAKAVQEQERADVNRRYQTPRLHEVQR